MGSFDEVIDLVALLVIAVRVPRPVAPNRLRSYGSRHSYCYDKYSWIVHLKSAFLPYGQAILAGGQTPR